MPFGAASVVRRLDSARANRFLAALPAMQRLEVGLLTAYCAVAFTFVLRQIQKWKNGVPLNIPKLLLFSAVVPLQWIAFGYAEGSGPDAVLRVGIVLGLFHSFQ